MENREKGKFKDNYWFRFGRNQNINKQKYKKILIPHVINKMRCAFDEKGKFALKNVGVNGITLESKINESPYYLMAILNSPIATFVISKISIFLSGGYYASNKQFAKLIPIKRINFSEHKEIAMHKQIIELVKNIIALKEQLLVEKIPYSKNILQRQINATDNKIDNLVYELYGLTEEEIRIVEEVT